MQYFINNILDLGEFTSSELDIPYIHGATALGHSVSDVNPGA